MTLSRVYLPSTRIEHEELDGLLRVLEREISERGENGDYSTAYYVGAQIAFTIIKMHDRIEMPDDFLAIFENYLNNITDNN